MISNTDLRLWCSNQFPEHLSLLKTLAAIPAPSHQEDLRASFIRDRLESWGADKVTIDSAKNVLLPLGEGSSRLAVLAHTDVVFPDTDPLPLREENGRLYAPGVGDDTANVAALMLSARFFLLHPELIPEPMLLVFNSCEEGLGNLKGVRQIMADHANEIHTLVSFDCQSDSIVSRAVGSERWRVTLTTRGGHSFSDFGSPSAIAHLACLVSRLYQQQVPQKENCRTTYNVGLISGGTSVNTIAQSAELTYEYRSDDRDCLALMADRFFRILEESQCPGVQLTVENIGIRPCGGDVPAQDHQQLLRRCSAAIRQVYDLDAPFCAASTDANIPLSLGIPAATFGLYRGGGAHTREEYVELSSLTPGLEIALRFFLQSDIDNRICP